jgi:hypothetical protein
LCLCKGRPFSKTATAAVRLSRPEAALGELRSLGKLKHAPPMRRSRLEMAKLRSQSFYLLAIEE